MKKVINYLLVFCLALGCVSTTSDMTAYGANTPQKAQKRYGLPSTQTVHKPIHEFVSFNDFQVVGVDNNGWNWVKNNEFILPPLTSLDIDISLTSYGKTGTFSSNRVFLDGSELTSYYSEMRSSSEKLQWNAPHITIPYSNLTPGIHLLTFVVNDGLQQSSTVNIKFRVEENRSSTIYEGTAAAGAPITNGSNLPIPGIVGSKRFFAVETGTWKLFKQGDTANALRTDTGQSFYTGNLAQGSYDLEFQPADMTLQPWKVTLQVGAVEIFQGSIGSGQKLAPGQRITAPNAPSTVQLSASVAGRWSVNGTDQWITGSKTFDVQIPEKLAGLTVTVSYQPDGGGLSSANSVLIDVPGGQNACDPSKATATMDILMQNNDKSSLQVEKVDLRATTSSIQLYQKPVYKVLLATSADHAKMTEEDDEEGPGVWAIDNMIVGYNSLNWDQTALELTRRGSYRINYYSKRNPNVRWCGTVTINEDTRPVPANESCDPGEAGEAPSLTPIRLEGKNGVQLTDGDKKVIDSPKDLSAYSALRLQANHVVRSGNKWIKKDPSNRKDRRFVEVPDLRWQYEQNSVGEIREYDGGTISSQNRVQVLYNDDVLKEFAPSQARSDVEDNNDVLKTLDLQSIIAKNNNKAGIYTVRVINELSYDTCRLEYYRNSYYKKYSGTETKKQTLAVTILLK